MTFPSIITRRMREGAEFGHFLVIKKEKGGMSEVIHLLFPFTALRKKVKHEPTEKEEVEENK